VVACAYLLHGVFLLTSVGIGVSKRARYYPMITAVVAVVNVAANFLLIPRFGMMGAAWATLASYAVMAAMGAVISQRLFPIPFERGRLLLLRGGCGRRSSRWEGCGRQGSGHGESPGRRRSSPSTRRGGARGATAAAGRP
jgi:hypothetical protein